MEHHPYEQHEGNIMKVEAEFDGADGSFKNEHQDPSKVWDVLLTEPPLGD